MEWFEDENFWRDLYPFMFPPERLAAAAIEVERVLALAGCTQGSVLDLCCGPGRHSVAFAQRGLAVTGVDKSPFLLGRARERAAETGVTVEWVLDDMRTFERTGAFDLACSLFTSFGYFVDERDDLRVLANIRRSLKPGGMLVMDVISKESLARRWQPVLYSEWPDGTRLVQRPQLRDNWTRVANDWTLIRGDRCQTFRFEHNLYSGRELSDRLRQAGFSEVRLHGNLEGAPYDVDAARLVAVARS